MTSGAVLIAHSNNCIPGIINPNNIGTMQTTIARKSVKCNFWLQVQKNSNNTYIFVGDNDFFFGVFTNLVRRSCSLTQN